MDICFKLVVSKSNLERSLGIIGKSIDLSTAETTENETTITYTITRSRCDEEAIQYCRQKYEELFDSWVHVGVINRYTTTVS